MPVLILSPNGSITERPNLVVVINDHPLQPDPHLLNTARKVLIITTDMTLAANVVVPFDVEIRFANYAVVTIPSGTTLDMSACQFQKPHYACFDVVLGGVLIMPKAGPISQDFEIAALNATGIATFGNAINEKLGSDVSSATPNLGAATGNYVNITGTTTIASFSGGVAGMRRIVNFQSSLTLTNNANLLLPVTGDIITAAGDRAEFVCLTTLVWICVFYQRASGLAVSPTPGNVVNRVSLQDATLADLAAGTAIPVTNAVIAVTQGTQFPTFTQSVSAKYANSLMKVRVELAIVLANASEIGTVALFRDTVCIASATHYSNSGQVIPRKITCEGFVAAGDTAAHTFSVRIGTNGSTITHINGNPSYSQGGMNHSTFTVDEVYQ